MTVERDRTRTFTLIELVNAAGTSAQERTAAFDELARTEDYRAIEPLTAMVLDTSLFDAVRAEASDVVAGFDDVSSPEIRRTWWASGDLVLMRHALRLMGRGEADIVVPVAGDDTHPLQTTALAAMFYGFDEPEFVPVIIRALGHPEPAVRAAAADTLLWEEPVAAEEALLAAAYDPAIEVAVAAVNTLRYYKSRRVLRAMADLCDSGDERVREAAADTFGELRLHFEGAAEEFDPGSVALLREWMRPVGDLIEWPEEVSPPYISSAYISPPTAEPASAIPEDELIAVLDGTHAELPYGIDWTAYDPDARRRLVPRLATHPDPITRARACGILAQWSDTGWLMELTRDRSTSVRKSAMYHLAAVPANPDVAECARRYLADAEGTTAGEALRTYLAHMDAERAVPALVEFARTDPREVIRREAITCLVERHADTEIRNLTDLLDEPPRVTWAVHFTILDGLHTLDLPAPPLDHLRTVDNLDLISSIALLTAR
ncbi:HEAT repeat domain-containing protein [Nocardia sp. NPDC052566]|uniref:HEAT repeat domain-containing protein n=1 Tax=Nocardia sp. NPDC052566 TaxID=3364330 RepID=UPI0037C53CA2